MLQGVAFKVVLLALVYAVFVVVPVGNVMFLAPLPPYLVVRILKEGGRASYLHIAMFVAVALAVAVVFQRVWLFVFVLPYIVPAVVMYVVYSKYPYRLFAPVALAPLPLVLPLVYILSFTGIYDVMHQQVVVLLQDYIKAAGPDFPQVYTDELMAAFEFAFSVLPALTYGVLVVLYYFVERSCYFRNNIVSGEVYPLPDALLVLIAVSGALKVYGTFASNEPFALVGLNMLLALSILCFIRGFDVVTYHLHSRRVPLVLRAIAYATLFTRYLFISIAVLGFASVFKDLTSKPASKV
ncbi:hypothetical protein RsTz2092_07770 [Deferribacterales bacterium RsTz2092]|nr:hypothetical protein AGMMS49941_05280 [Deferribacterales bacterium]